MYFLETNGSRISFTPFHGFSPILETLHIDSIPIPSSHIFNLILSFPLKNIAVITYGGSDHAMVFGDRYLAPIKPHPLNPPAFTGYLELSIFTGIGPIVSRLLSLPGCLRFQRLDLMLHRGYDMLLAMALVESCCATLETLCLKFPPTCTYARHTSLH